MRARESVRKGLRAVLLWPRVSLAALLAATVALLSLSAAWHHAVQALHVAARSGDGSFVGVAIGAFLFGSGFAALLGNVTRTVALTAYSPPSPSSASGARSPFVDGLRRTPAMITLQAIELTVCGMLAFGAVAILVRHAKGLPPGRAALFSLLVLLPPGALGIVQVAVTRVAMTLAARGQPPAVALVRGYDLVARRFPSLLGLAALLFVRTLPLTVPALVAAMAAIGASPRVTVALDLVRAVCLSAAALWGYAALAVWVGSDDELAGG